MPSAECGALFERYAAVKIISPWEKDGKPLTASMSRIMAVSALPTRSDITICCGVFVPTSSQQYACLPAVDSKIVADELITFARPWSYDSNAARKDH